MNKKGNILDWFLIIVILMIVGLMIIVVWSLLNNSKLNAVWQENNVEEYVQGGKNAILTMDNMFIVILVGLSLFVIISSALVYNHPAMFFFSVLILAIAVTFSAIAANTYYDITNNQYFSQYLDTFPKMIWVMNHLATYIALMGVAGLTAMFVGYRYQ